MNGLRLALVILVSTSFGLLAEDNGYGKYIDVHMHLMATPAQRGGMGGGPRSQQNTQRPRSREDLIKTYMQGADNLVKMMDKRGVKQALVMPPPQKEGQANKVKNNYRNCLAAAKKHPGRLIPAGGGAFLNPVIHAKSPKDVTQKDKAKFRGQAESLVRAGIRAFGEMSVLHIAMSERHNYSAAPADHPLFLELADVAAKHHMAIDIHMEALESASPPVASLARVSHNPKTIPATIPGLEKLLEHNREANIVWQHIGWDNTGQMTPELVGRLLEKHPNLYCALRVEQQHVKARPFAPNRLTDSNEKIKPEWLALFHKFPDRFVAGADEFVGIPGKTRKMPESFDLTWQMVKSLPPDLARKIGYENPKRIYYLK